VHLSVISSSLPDGLASWSQKTVDIGRVLSVGSLSSERIEESGGAKTFILTSLESKSPSQGRWQEPGGL